MGEANRRKKLGLGPRPAPAALRLARAAGALFAKINVPPLADLAGRVLVVDWTRGDAVPPGTAACADEARHPRHVVMQRRALILAYRADALAWCQRYAPASGRALAAMPEATAGGVLPALEIGGRFASGAEVVGVSLADIPAREGYGPLWPELAQAPAESA